MSTEVEKICTILDKLTLDALTLMEENVQMKLNIENAMCNGETHLAKARYIMGQNSVSRLQLPSENGSTFNATAQVITSTSDQTKSFDLQFGNGTSEKTAVEPLRWFGVLLPHDMWRAQAMFKQALQWVVRAGNIQLQLDGTCRTIEALKERKIALVVTGEE